MKSIFTMHYRTLRENAGHCSLFSLFRWQIISERGAFLAEILGPRQFDGRGNSEALAVPRCFPLFFRRQRQGNVIVSLEPSETFVIP